MRYYYDTEFIESGPSKPLQLISVGIAAQDGREYYSQACWFDYTLADVWVWNHVFTELTYCTEHTEFSMQLLQTDLLLHSNGKCKLNEHCPWRTRLQLINDLLDFTNQDRYGEIELWGWYSAYDHVLFSQLFGKMILLPRQFPMLTHDIKTLHHLLGQPILPERPMIAHHALADAIWMKEVYTFLSGGDDTQKRAAVRPTLNNKKRVV